MSYRVGLTGGIGSGKSTVAGLFANLGVPIIDTDTISHQLTQANGPAIPAIRAAFGDEYIDSTNALDRTRMRETVFSDISAKQKLEKILHPLILAEAIKQAESSTAPYILLVIPLLFETGTYRGWLHRTVTVDCPEETQLERLSRRNGLKEQTARSIISQQLPRMQRVQLADDVIRNDGDIAFLNKQVSSLNQHYLKLAQISN